MSSINQEINNQTEISACWKCALQWAIGAQVFPLKQPYEVADPNQLRSPKHQGWRMEATNDDAKHLYQAKDRDYGSDQGSDRAND